MGVPLLAEISAKASKAEDGPGQRLNHTTTRHLTLCLLTVKGKREMVRQKMKGDQKQKRLAAKSRTLIWRTQSPELIMASAAADRA